jgi:hypothetical protein
MVSASHTYAKLAKELKELKRSPGSPLLVFSTCPNGLPGVDHIEPIHGTSTLRNRVGRISSPEIESGQVCHILPHKCANLWSAFLIHSIPPHPSPDIHLPFFQVSYLFCQYTPPLSLTNVHSFLETVWLNLVQHGASWILVCRLAIVPRVFFATKPDQMEPSI